MNMLVLYIPKPSEFAQEVAFLAIIFLTLCAFACRFKLSVGGVAAGMLLGAAVALTKDLSALWHADLGGYGDMARESSSTQYSDRFFAITSYFHMGRGKLVAFGGMLVALLLCATIQLVRRGDRSGMSDAETALDPTPTG